MPRLLMVSTVVDTLKGFLFPYADHFRARGWRVEGMARGAGDNQACAEHFDAVHEIDWSRSLFDNRRLGRILRRVREVAAGCDIVHVHTPNAAFLTRLAMSSEKSGKRPCVIYTVHGFHFQAQGSPIVNLIYKTAEKLGGRWTDFLITINETDRRAALQLGIVPPERLRLMPGIGISRAWYSRGAVDARAVAEVRKSFGIPDNAPLFIMVAEFSPNKRHVDAIEALARMERRDAHLLLVGTGPGAEEIKRLAENSGAGGRIHFAGQQPDVRPFIVASTALVLCSAREGLPRSIMESLCCGVPVIGSDIRGTRDLLADGGGSLYPCRDVIALAGQLDWYAANPEQAAEIGLRASEKMAHYDIANVIRLHEEMYSAALGMGHAEISERLMSRH